MSNYLALTKILFKNSLSTFSNSKKGGKKSGKIKNIALMAIVLLSLLPMAFGIGMIIWGSYGVFHQMGQEGLILGTALMMVSMMIMFFGIFYIMNIFYFSKDVESLLPLPLRPSTIMAAKFTVTLLYEYVTEILFLAPILIAYGIASGAGIVYYLYALICFLVLPVVPLVYAGIMNIILMRVTNIGKNRDRFRIIGGIIAMFVAIFANLKMQSLFQSAMDPEQVKEMLMQGNNSLLGLMTGIFPANKLMAIALVNNGNIKGFINILLFLGIALLFTALFLTLGESFYFKGLAGISESHSKRKKLTGEQFEKSLTASSAIKAYTIKELRLLVRTPIYFINCVLMNFLWPVFFLIPFMVNSGDTAQLSGLKVYTQSGDYHGIVLAVAFAAILFASGTNGITPTAISREGSNIFVNKYLPVSYYEQIMGKVFSGVLLGVVALLSMLAATIFVAAPSLLLIILIIICGLMGIFFTSFVGILIDLNFPKLHWDNEQRAVKQNMNVMVQLLVSMVVAAIVAVPTFIFQLNLWIVFAALILLFGFADAVLFGLVKSAGVKLFENIEA